MNDCDPVATSPPDRSNAVQMILYLGLALLIIGVVFLFYSHQSGMKMASQVKAAEKDLAATRGQLASLQESQRRAQTETDRLKARIKELEQDQKVMTGKISTSKKWFSSLQDTNRQLTDVTYDIRLSMGEYISILKPRKDPELERIAHELAEYALALDDLFVSGRGEEAPPKTGKASAHLKNGPDEPEDEK